MTGKDDRARLEQILGECFLKAANIVLGARIHQTSKTLQTSKAPQRCWFNLDIEETGAQEEIQAWRRSFSQPLTIEIFTAGSSSRTEDRVSPRDDKSSNRADPSGLLLERWCIRWEAGKQPGKHQSSRLEPGAIYKRLVITLRSLFSYVRILPAYRLHRAAKRGKSNGPKLLYRIIKHGTADVSPMASQGIMQHFDFTPVETPHGVFQMGVQYQPASAIPGLEQSIMPVAGSSPHFIPDYFGSQRQQAAAAPQSTLSASLHGLTAATQPSQSGPEASVARQPSIPQGSPLLRRQSWSLNSSRAQSSGELPLPASHSPAPPSRSNSSGSGAHLPQIQTKGSRLSPPAFAPGTPTAAATPPKYPGSGLASRMTQAAAQAAAKLYTGMARGPSPSSRGPSTPSSERSSPARQMSHTGGEELRTFRSSSPAAARDEMGHSQAVPDTRATPTARPCSQPVRIPGCEKGSRRLRSSENLHGMTSGQAVHLTSQKAASRPQAPASAPAAPTYIGFNVEKPDKGPGDQPGITPFKTAACKEKAPQPETPPVLQTLLSLGSESSNSFASSFPASCSPQLPFAFTPSSHSHLSAADGGLQRRESGVHGPSPPNKGVSALAVLRQPSWTRHSLSSDAADKGQHPIGVGYSISPMLNSLESSLLSSFTPKHARQQLISQASSPLAPIRGASLSQASSSAYTMPRLTHPIDAALLASDDTEGDSLPFALDREPSLPSHSQPRVADSSLAGTNELDPSLAGREIEPDAAVGAFVRLIQEAPPLERSESGHGSSHLQQSRHVGTEMSLQAGLDQLAKLQLQLSQLPLSSGASASLQNAEQGLRQGQPDLTS